MVSLTRKDLTIILKMNKAIEYLNQHQSATPSKWRDNAQWRRDNERWLEYSRFITMKVMRTMDERSVTQSELAERMGCSQQYVSNLLKGSSNMTLETISRIEDALNIDILHSLLSSVSGYSESSQSSVRYLSDGDQVPYGNKTEQSTDNNI